MSVEEMDTDLDVDGNAVTVTITQRRKLQIDDLFDENSEFQIWEDTAGVETTLLVAKRFGRRFTGIELKFLIGGGCIVCGRCIPALLTRLRLAP